MAFWVFEIADKKLTFAPEFTQKIEFTTYYFST